MRLSVGNNRLLPFQMYVLSVLWSDQNDIVIYRTLKEFKKMHVSCFFPAGLNARRHQVTRMYCFCQ